MGAEVKHSLLSGSACLQESFSCSVVSDSLRSHGRQPPRLLCPWGFSRQEYWSGLLFLSPGDLPEPGIEPIPLMSLALAGGFFTTSTTWEGLTFWAVFQIFTALIIWVKYRGFINLKSCHFKYGLIQSQRKALSSVKGINDNRKQAYLYGKTSRGAECWPHVINEEDS